MRALRDVRGFTLIELLIALAIMAVLSTQLFLVFQTQKETYVQNERVLDAQEDARLVVDLIAADARMAGYMIPREAGVASVDGGTSDADAFCVSDWTVIADSVLDSAGDHFDRGRVGSVVSGTRITLSSLAQFNVDSDAASTNDFVPTQGIIISDGSRSHCAQIVAIETGSSRIDFDTAIPSTTVTALNANIAAVRAVPAVIYRITGGLGLSRNGVVVSSEIEDLQVEFGVDSNADSQLTGSEFPRHTLTGFNPALVRSIRISVVARSPQPDPEYQDDERKRPANANRAAGTADTFLRRRFIESVLPRNLI